MVIVLMGVSGSGKTTVGKVLAEQLGWPFVDADDYHPPANVAKMRQGIPLNDEDRRPWLDALADVVGEMCEKGVSLVLACSALKHAYQDYLRRAGCIRYVLLTAPEELIAERLAKRKGHFMNPALLHSQFETLEAPEGAVTIDVTPPPDQIAAEIRRTLGL